MTQFERLAAGLTFERAVTVDEMHTVGHTGVRVLSTPMMIGMMESASFHIVQPLLPPGYTTVGYEVHVKHKAPAFLGAELKVESRLAVVDGRRLLFEIRVTEGENVIGEGTHRRTIIQLPGRPQ